MTKRPTISPKLVAEFTSNAPGRLIKKLDKAPDRAESWTWNIGEVTTIQTNADAVVTLTGTELTKVDHVSCDCLLAPKCLHLLSVITRLEFSDGDASEPDESDYSEQESDAMPVVSDILATDVHREAALGMREAISEIIADGVSSASIVAQGKLLSALHHARVVGLHRSSGAATRAIKRIRAIRDGKSESLNDLRADLIDILDSCEAILTKEKVSIGDLGVGRRRYHDAGSMRLHGIVTSAIGGVSGYGGCVTYLIDDDGNFSTLSTVTPLDMGGVQQAWQTAVSVGDIVAPHKELCRKTVFVQDATRSDDGRLGAGKKVKAVIGKDVDYNAGPISKWFNQPLEKQIERVFAAVEIPILTRPPGWDFLAFEARVLGVCEGGVGLLIGEDTFVIGKITYDTKGNLNRLGEMVGSVFKFVGRVELDSFSSVQLVTLIHESTEKDAGPIAVQLGLEFFQIERERSKERIEFSELPKVWGPFDRTLERAMIGGWRAFPPQSIKDVNLAKRRMRMVGMNGGAGCLESLYRAAQRDDGKVNVEAFTNSWRSGVKYREHFLRTLVQGEWLRSEA